MEFEALKLLPPNGVYTSRVSMDGAVYPGVTNVGCKPTVSDSGRVGVETHVIGYEGDLYGRTLTVQFLHFIRPEMQFSSVEALREQMQRDIAASGSFYQNQQRK